MYSEKNPYFSADAPELFRALEQRPADISALLDAGADIDERYYGETVLQYAVPFCLAAGRDMPYVSLETIALLLSRGADPNAQDNDGNTALHGIVLYLIAGGPAPDANSCAVLLLDHGANIALKDNSGSTPLGMAYVCGDAAIIRLLRRKRAPFAMCWLPDPLAVPAEIFFACVEDDTAQVAAFLDAGQDIEQRDPEGWTLLHRAAHGGSEAMALLLLERGANIAAIAENQDSEDHCREETALHLAAQRSHTEVVRLLLDSGADITARGLPDRDRSEPGRTPLHAAVHGAGLHYSPESMATVRLLLERGAAEIVRSDPSALYDAAHHRCPELVALLLEFGAGFSQEVLQTAVKYAECCNSYKNLDPLSRAGAILSLEDSARFGCRELLEQAMAAQERKAAELGLVMDWTPALLEAIRSDQVVEEVLAKVHLLFQLGATVNGISDHWLDLSREEVRSVIEKQREAELAKG